MRFDRKLAGIVVLTYLIVSTLATLFSAQPLVMSAKEGWCWQSVNVYLAGGDSLEHRFRLSLPYETWDHNPDHVELYYRGMRVDGEYPVDDTGARRSGDRWVFGIFTRWVVLETLLGGPLGGLMTQQNANWWAHVRC